MTNSLPRLALDMYVLAQGVKTGVYRVCDELFPRLAQLQRLSTRLFYRQGDEAKAAAYVAAKQLSAPLHHATFELPSQDADIFLSPFGVAPTNWLSDTKVLHAHIIYDLIGINRPEFFSAEAAAEVRNIVDSLDEDTVIFVISECTKKELLACRPDLNPRQIAVISLAAGPAFQRCHSAASIAAVRTKYGIPADVSYVLSLATLEIRKNLDQVVNAFVQFLEQNQASRMHLVLSGMSGWKLEQLHGALAAAQKWRPRIVLTGFVDDSDLSALYSGAVCFVYLSRYEGFGLPPLEAMACGAPVICSNNSSLPEVVGQAGIMLDADDVQGVANALRQIESSEQVRMALSEAGLKRAKLFSWERCTEIVVDTLCNAYNLHSARPSKRRHRPLHPGTFVSRAMRPDGHLEANFLHYQNGSHGPTFLSKAAAPTGREGSDWPQWTDRLPRRVGIDLIEGGLRTGGILKTGTQCQPLVTYVTVVRNNTATLARTIESVQGQSYPNVEHVVLDGASTDGTLDLVRRHEDVIDYFVSEPDKGLYDAINKAIPLARGQLICILNSDDWLDPHAAEIAVYRMKDIEDAALLLTAVNVRDADTEWYPAFVHPGCYFKYANDCHNGIYATRAAYEVSGPYDTSYRIAADFKWIMTCLERHAKFVYTRERTVNYSLSGVSGDGQQHSRECMRIIAERFPTLSQREISGLHDCFFTFQQGSAVVDSPVKQTKFLRELFADYASDTDFVQALTWASIEKLEIPVHQNATSYSSPSVRELIKAAIRGRPSAYRLAKRIASMLERY